MYKCPECGNTDIRKITNKKGISKYYCQKCDCYLIPSWLMDENKKIWNERKHKE